MPLAVRAPAVASSPVSIAVATETDRERWDGFVLRRCGGCLLQTWGWGELRRRYGWVVDRFLAFEEGGGIRGAMLMQSRAGPGPLGLAYAPRGPAIAEPARDSEFATALIEQARAVARQRRALLLKLDPEWPVDDAAAAAIFAATRARPSWYDIQHRLTYLVDLEGGADAVLARVKASTRHHIRRAEREGVEVSFAADPAAVASFHPLYLETARRSGVVPRDAGYHRALVECVGTSCPVAILVARVAGEAAAAMIAVAAGPRLIYFFGGSTPRHARHHPSYLMHWRAILWGLEHGCTMYDMWGVPNHEDPNAPGAGYYEFKTRWNGRVARHHRCHEVRPWPMLGPLPRLAERVALRGRPMLT
jgi:peptidoglycan pentaglycine glycine transferase (the first glycine)